MNFCKKCGAVMAFASGICTRCGTQNGGAGDSSTGGGFGAGVGPAWGRNPGMQGRIPDPAATVANNPDYARNDLIRTLEKYKSLLAECEELKGMIKPQSSFPTSEQTDFKKRSFIKFFWPFLVAAPVAYYVVYLLSTFIAVFSLRDVVDSDYMSRTAMTDTLMGMIVALIIAGAIIFFGVKVSKRKQADFNRNAEYMNREASERYQKGLQNQRMITLYQENQNEMRLYEKFVPEKYRTAAQLEAIIEIIKDKRADTVEDAIELL